MMTFRSSSSGGVVVAIVVVMTMAMASLCTAYRSTGFPCRATFQCASAYCNSTLQCDVRGQIGQTCPNHDACLSLRCSGGVCQEQKQTGETCDVDEDCLEGYCNATCMPLKEREEGCVDDRECKSGRCTRNPRVCTFVIYEPNICGKDSDCYGGRCKKDDGLNRCYARKWNNEFCNHNSDCLSLRCETRNCTEPLWPGEGPCDEPSDCYSLFCNKDTGCVATPSEASSFDPEPSLPGIAGTEEAEILAGGGSVDVTPGGSGGTDFNGGGSWAVSMMLATTARGGSGAFLAASLSSLVLLFLV